MHVASVAEVFRTVNLLSLRDGNGAIRPHKSIQRMASKKVDAFAVNLVVLQARGAYTTVPIAL